jgi:LacI family transcriptional regulator
MVTLEDLARMAGVSHSTVSRALANSSLVSAETRERIQRLASEAGYQVNQVARNLKTRSTKTIGLIVPEVSNPYYPRLIQHVADLVRASGFCLHLQLSGAVQESEAICLASQREQRVDGILLVTAERGLVARSQVESLASAGVPIVLMGWVEDADHVDMVTGDDAAGGYELGAYLLDLGHKRFAVIGKPPHRGVFDRIHGFEKALDEAGIRLPDELRLAADSEEGVERGVNKLLAQPDPPTAIFAYQDSLAALVYKHLGIAGVSIPAEMTVAGFDDLDLATYLNPPLTTVGTHLEPLATQFVGLLLDRIHRKGETNPPKRVVITTRLIVRSSCAPPRASSLRSAPSPETLREFQP